MSESTVFGIMSSSGDLLRRIKLVDKEWQEVGETPTCYISERLEPALRKKRKNIIIGGVSHKTATTLKIHPSTQKKINQDKTDAKNNYTFSSCKRNDQNAL